MNDFVEECRIEWKRLGVPDPVANEMAADLAADLEEAEADGVSAEEVLGGGAFDPRSFATDWAAERGVVQRPLQSGQRLPRGSRMLAAIGAFALIAITGAVLVILASASVPTRLTLASPVRPPLGAVPLGAVWVRPDPQPGPGARAVIVRAASPDGRLLAIESASGSLTIRPFVSAVDIDDSGANTRTIGTVLLIVGLAGVVPFTMFWLWVGPDRRSRRRAHIDDRPSGPVY